MCPLLKKGQAKSGKFASRMIVADFLKKKFKGSSAKLRKQKKRIRKSGRQWKYRINSIISYTI